MRRATWLLIVLLAGGAWGQESPEGYVHALGADPASAAASPSTAGAQDDLLRRLRARHRPVGTLNGGDARRVLVEGKPLGKPSGVYGDYRLARELLFGYADNLPSDSEVVVVYLPQAFFTSGPQTPLTGVLEDESAQALRLRALDGTQRLTLPRSAVADVARTGRVPLLYSGREVHLPRFGQARACGGEVSCVPPAEGLDGVNCEHVWPKSKFHPEKRGPCLTDLHNLRPTLTLVNAARSSHPFGEIDDQATAFWWRSGKPCQEPPADPAGRDGCSESLTELHTAPEGQFEPREAAKGDVARVLLYVYAVYHADDPSAPPADPADPILDEAWFFPQLPDLVRWHRLDPPDAAERARNERVERVQGNRNPFVDDPGLFERAARAIATTRVADPALRAAILEAAGACAPPPAFHSAPLGE